MDKLLVPSLDTILVHDTLTNLLNHFRDNEFAKYLMCFLPS